MFLWVFIAFYPADIARSKGHSFWGYFFLSIVFFPLAVILALKAEDRLHEHEPIDPNEPDDLDNLKKNRYQKKINS